MPAPKSHVSKEEPGKLQASQSPDRSEAKSRHKDTDSTFTKKHGKSDSGYKFSVSVDYKHGLIRGVVTGTANEHDGHHFDDVLDTSNTDKAADADKS